MKLNYRNIAQLGETATLLEVSGYPKPGNVHRTKNFENMLYEDFLISSVILRENLEQVAYSSSRYFPNMLHKIGIGKAIYNTVRNTNNLVQTNTNLGISMLFIPIAAAFGSFNEQSTIANLPRTVKLILKSTQTNDAISLVNAIVLSKAGGMDNKTSKYDAKNDNTINDIIQNNVNIYDLFRMSAMYDKISYELINGLPVLSEYGYPAYAMHFRDYSQNDVTLQIFLTILANVPDTLIYRKYGKQVAVDVSKRAKEILKTTEIATYDRLKALNSFDKYLREKKYNPGTTADFTAASLFIGLVDRYSVTGLINK